MGRAREKKGRQQESLQGTNLLQCSEHHLVFICNTNLAAAPEHPVTPTVLGVIRARSGSLDIREPGPGDGFDGEEDGRGSGSFLPTGRQHPQC